MFIDPERFLAKWFRYVHPERQDYSATSDWGGVIPQHLVLMPMIPEPYKDVLDMGCGDGWTTNHFLSIGKNAIGLTVNSKEADHARSTFGIELVIHDFHDLPFDDASFDVVYARESLEHSVAPYIVMCEVNRVLRSGGHIVMTMPGTDWIRYDDHFSVMSTEQMAELFFKCRFTVIDSGLTELGLNYYVAEKSAELEEPFEHGEKS